MITQQPVVGVGAVVRWGDAVLLVKRGRPPYAGEWAIPGGKVNFGETLGSAAERELLEETGIRIRAGEPAYIFEHLDPDAGIHLVVVDLFGEYLGGELQAGDDAAEAAWVPLGEIVRWCVNTATRDCLAHLFPGEVGG